MGLHHREQSSNANASVNSGTDASVNAPGKDRKTKIPLKLLAPMALMVILIARSIFSKNQSIQQVAKGSDGSLVSTVERKANRALASCRFRDYVGQHKQRLYGMASANYPEPFLKTSTYIYGEKPILLDGSSISDASGSSSMVHAAKLCSDQPAVDASEFTMDGTNPSIIDLSRISTFGMDPLDQSVRSSFASAKYVVSLTNKASHQCTYSYNMTAKAKMWKKPRSGVLPGRQRAHEIDIVLMDERLRPLISSTVQISQSALSSPLMTDALHALQPSDMIKTGLDDGRLFVHDSRLWLSYRRYYDGTGDVQCMSPLRLYMDTAEVGEPRTLKAEVVREMEMLFGRNMAFLDQPRHSRSSSSSSLQLLQWLDPVWVQSLDLSSVPGIDQSESRSSKTLEHSSSGDNRRLEQDQQQEEKKKKKKTKKKKTKTKEKQETTKGTKKKKKNKPRQKQEQQEQQEKQEKPEMQFDLVQPTMRLVDIANLNGDDATTTPKQRQEIKFRLPNPPNMAGQSSFHGTSGMLLYIPDLDEYIGLGHFNRYRRWSRNRIDAKFGHHYTHAFFTIGLSDGQYALRSLSQEFVFPSQHTPSDADVIQFATGLEAVFADGGTPSELIVSYGINDCEAAALVVKWELVASLLRRVDSSQGKREARHFIDGVEEWKPQPTQSDTMELG